MNSYIFNDEDGICDKETFNAVRNSINRGRLIPYISKINLKKAYKTKSLSLFNKKQEIANLKFLKFIPNLVFLEIRSGRLRDLAPLKYTPKLDQLFLYGVNIDSLQPLSYLKELEQLTLEKIRVKKSDFYILGELKKLKNLHAFDCGITNIDWIVKMEALEIAGFDGNVIADYSPVKQAKKLKMVSTDKSIYEVPFDDIS